MTQTVCDYCGGVTTFGNWISIEVSDMSKMPSKGEFAMGILENKVIKRLDLHRDCWKQIEQFATTKPNSKPLWRDACEKPEGSCIAVFDTGGEQHMRAPIDWDSEKNQWMDEWGNVLNVMRWIPIGIL